MRWWFWSGCGVPEQIVENVVGRPRSGGDVQFSIFFAFSLKITKLFTICLVVVFWFAVHACVWHVCIFFGWFLVLVGGFVGLRACSCCSTRFGQVCRVSRLWWIRLYKSSAREPWLNGSPRACTFFIFVFVGKVRRCFRIEEGASHPTSGDDRVSPSFFANAENST